MMVDMDLILCLILVLVFWLVSILVCRCRCDSGVFRLCVMLVSMVLCFLLVVDRLVVIWLNWLVNWWSLYGLCFLSGVM